MSLRYERATVADVVDAVGVIAEAGVPVGTWTVYGYLDGNFGSSYAHRAHRRIASLLAAARSRGLLSSVRGDGRGDDCIVRWELV